MASTNHNPLLVQAIYSFKGKNNDELCFKKGDIITVTQKEEGGWWEGTLAGTTGWFPSNYVKEHKAQGIIMTDVNKAVSPVKLPVDLTAQQKVYRNLVLKDLIDSEKAHVAELQTLISNFLHPLEKSEILTRDEYRQLVGNMDSVLETHSKLLIALEACNELQLQEQRVGKLFLTSAPQIKQIHLSYCSSHPRAVCILNKYKDALNGFMEAQGAASPGLLVLTTGLSKPFRRLEKYSGIMQELERHIEENHPDRGDTQRSISVYKDIWSACSAKRRQKEQELEILTGGVRGWEGEELSSLGEILHMGSVAVGPDHRDRYLVLFPTTLLMLSVSTRMSGFIYEGKLPLSGINVTQLPDSESYKNAFEITGTLIDRIVAVCQTREDQQAWVEQLKQAIRALRKSSVTSPQPNPPPHVSSQFTCPYYELTEYFASLVKAGVITRGLLKRLLYRQFADESVSIVGVKVRRSHRVECVIFPTKLSFGTFTATRTWIKSGTIEIDSENISPRTISTSSEGGTPLLERQDAVDFDSDENPYGFIKYFSTEPKRYSVKVTLTPCEDKEKLLLGDVSSEQSSFEVPPKPITQRACEDLSALEMDRVVLNEESGRNSLPSPLCPLHRQSSEVVLFERSASVDPAHLSNCESDKAPDFQTSSERSRESFTTVYPRNYVSSRSDSKESASDPRVQRVLSTSPPLSPPHYSYHFVQVTHGLSGDYCKCCKDVHSSPRSSDSGLADITGTCHVVSPDYSGFIANEPELSGLEPWSDSPYANTNTAAEFEAQCICSSPFGSTPRTSAQPSVTSENVFIESVIPSCQTTYYPSPNQSGNIYRSGMYAHWWLKTRIPAEAIKDPTKTSRRKKKDVTDQTWK